MTILTKVFQESVQSKSERWKSVSIVISRHQQHLHALWPSSAQPLRDIERRWHLQYFLQAVLGFQAQHVRRFNIQCSLLK